MHDLSSDGKPVAIVTVENPVQLKILSTDSLQVIRSFASPRDFREGLERTQLSGGNRSLLREADERSRQEWAMAQAITGRREARANYLETEGVQ